MHDQSFGSYSLKSWWQSNNMKPKQYETKKDYILESLKDRILSGTFGPGFHLKTRQIAEEYGTSEIPVREALSQLASMGLVRIIPHVGAITSTLSSHDLKEIFQIRETLESLAVRLAVPQLTDDDINQITDIAQALEKAVTEGAAPDRLNYLNRQFHTQIYQHCDNQRLIHIIDDLWNHATRYPGPLTGNNPETLQSLQDHQDIVTALKERDAETAELVTLTHKRRAMRRIIQKTEQEELRSRAETEGSLLH